MTSRHLGSALVVAGLFFGQLGAAQQQPTAAPPAASSPVSVDQYETEFEGLLRLSPVAASARPLHHVTLVRDVLSINLEDGVLYEATPVAGRVIAAVFVGRGDISFTPPYAMERAELRRKMGSTDLAAPITAIAFVATDTTLAELERHGTSAPAGSSDAAAAALHDAMGLLLDEHTHDVEQPHLMEALLNGQASGFFYAHVKQAHGEDLVFVLDPRDAEGVSLLRKGRERGQHVQVVSQFPRQEDLADSLAPGTGERDPLAIESSLIEATLGKHLAFSAAVTLRLTARAPGVRWAPLELFHELQVDSLWEDAGPRDTMYRFHGSPRLWVRFDAPLQVGETRALRIAYHGGVVEVGSLLNGLHFGPGAPTILADRWFIVKTPSFWFPRYGFPWQSAETELDFHTPKQYRFAAIGRLVSSRESGDTLITRWISERPASQVCFSIGDFQEFDIHDPRLPPVTVQVNVDAHRQLGAFLIRARGEPERNVAGDVATSLSFFSHVYGPPMFSHYYATEIPGPYGEAFPGLMYLSVWTFQLGTGKGDEQLFRSHEVAHQWWGVGVEPQGERDVWLSEGFAEFSGLWYMHTVQENKLRFFEHLDEWRHELRGQHDPRPIALGHRVENDDYQTTVYEKSAWVLQMLRNMMIDFPTMNEDRFTAMMQDFYQEYRGRRASTHDFQRVVERHTGQSMDWFFKQWIDGTAIPTYTFSWHAEADTAGKHALHLRVRQDDVPSDFTMPVPVYIVFADGTQAYVRINVRGALTETTIPLSAEPKQVQLNPLESVLADVKTKAWEK